MRGNVTTCLIKEPCHLSFHQLRELPDEELMIHLQNGHDDALAILFDRFHRLVFSIANRIVRDAGEAEDVMQTVFLEIYRAATRFDASKGSTKVWILQYVYHRAIDRRQQLASRNFYNQAGVRQSYNYATAAPSCSALSTQECSVLVREALLRLSKEQKNAIELAYFNGLTMQEIAEQTGETVANVRHHFYRGLDKIRSCLRIEPKRVRVTQEEISRVES